MKNINPAHMVAQVLMDIHAVCLQPQAPFTWASGLRAPIYTDNRLIMSYPEARETIEATLAKVIQTTYPDVTVIAGTATAGIPHAAFVAAQLRLPMIYVRSTAKDHGKGRAIEGRLEKGDKVVLIEDLVSTGRSVLNAAQQIQAEGGEVLAVVSIFNYQLASGQKAFKEAGVSLTSLTDYPTLLEVATADGELARYRDSLEEWYKDPEKWSQQHQNV